ncbi:hypothetical protein WJX73_002525 [Symbiochloris irregularis]|uniref:Uncharacterized protein n=1 Tax=Symbiochloris irregularis TaxID=706552 RepID=A0AAW1NMN7_9CHLO
MQNRRGACGALLSQGRSAGATRREGFTLAAGALLWLQGCGHASAALFPGEREPADVPPPPTQGLDKSAPGGAQAKFATLKDSLLAYEFNYPIEAGGRKISLVASRKPERYSSAAPLSADARQRLVAELVDFLTAPLCQSRWAPHQAA